ncbi:hypothetical protein G8770_05015 [Aestuariicella hydrocarbonica]|uniref:Membrane transport protein MMPL domain-containing protein n=1 Tax=Pseudomaricurvus hydrocarbonicus TaxID=1470433 RepID=A0A9E5MJC5_9GAMM|nr:hypothetical protein [Aestuariicella hydrocarbonica]NHO64899.1 hypothetical protein [Aestuariicella hydrocarbonica]
MPVSPPHSNRDADASSDPAHRDRHVVNHHGHPPSSNADVWRFSLWSVVVAICGVIIALELHQGQTFDSSIMALLPDTHRSDAEALAQQRLMDAADDRLVFLIAAEDPSLSRSAAETFAKTLTSSQHFANVQGAVSQDSHHQWQAFYKPWRYRLLTQHSLDRLQKFDTGLVDESLAKLFSPLAAAIGPTLTEDPLQLFMQWQTEVLPRTPFRLQDDWLTLQHQGLTYRLVTATLSGNAYDMPYQQAVMSTLNHARQRLPGNTQLATSGLIIHAAFGAQQAKREISTIGVGSAVGILLLLFTCFRRWSRVLLAFLPLIVGCVVALSLSMLLFERLHLITLAFGASLIGVAIDYSLHYLCAREEREPPNRAMASTPTRACGNASPLRRILPGLSLGLLSSVLAYAAQAAAPFPGLQQMAVFSVLGLVGAWMTVVCWLPLLSAWQPAVSQTTLLTTAQKVAPQTSQQPSQGLQPMLLRQLVRWRRVWPTCHSRRSQVFLLCVLALLIAIVSRIEGNDDLRLLQTSPAELLQQDATVQALLAGPDPSHYFILQADSEQALLQAEEQFTRQLDQGRQQHWISGYQSTAQFVPSNEKQQLSHSLYQTQVFAEDGLLTQWASKGQLQPVADRARALFNQSRAHTEHPPGATELSLNSWQLQPVSELARHLWLGPHQGHFYSLITVSGIQGSHAITHLQALANSTEGVSFIDRVGSISEVLKNYRQHLSQWLLLAYAAVTLVLALRYRTQVWRIIAAPALASLITLSALQLCHVPVTIFHGLALLLVLGIGLDASIFLYDSRNSAHTWLAVTLSSLTTLLAFGLLTLSATPVLHFFGQTVLIGIICVWFLAPAFAAPKPASHNNLALRPDA